MIDRAVMSFSAALDDCRARVEAGEALETCLGDYDPDLRSELARLLPVAISLGRLASDPTPAFESRLATQLHAEMARSASTPPPGVAARLSAWLAPAPALRWAAILALILVAVGGGGAGVVAASNQSLPDSPLYQIKEARESAELIFVREPEQQVAVQLTQLAIRERELGLAIDSGKNPRVVQLIVARTSAATERLVDQTLDARARGNPRPALRVTALLEGLQRQTERLMAEAAPAARLPLQQLETQLAEQQRRLAPTPL